MRITTDGDVGIGTSSPAAKLDVVVASGTAKVKIGDGTVSGGAYVNLQGNSVGKTWFVASNLNVGNALEFIQSTANGGSTPASTASMIIDGSGNVGIGTTSPNSQLNVSAAANARIELTATSGGPFRHYLRTQGNDLQIMASSGVMQFYTGATDGLSSTERMRIDSSGNLLVGATASGQPDANYFMARDASGFQANIGHATGTASGQPYVYMVYGGVAIGSITQDGTTGVLYNLTSDARLKTNIVDCPSGNIDDVKVRSFDWKSDSSHVEYGFIAQELVEVAPYAVHQPQDPEEMMAVDYSKLVPMMIKEIQDLKQRIKTLENN
jgi:hypothetical protein